MLESITSKLKRKPRTKRFSFGKAERRTSDDTALTALLPHSPSSSSLSSTDSMAKKHKTVRFSDARIYEFPTIPGGNTVASVSGPPIALGYLTNNDDDCSMSASNSTSNSTSNTNIISQPQSPSTTSPSSTSPSSPSSTPSATTITPSKPTRVMTVAVSDMERYQRLHSRCRYRPLSDRRRRDLLAKNGHSEKDIQEAVTQATFTKQQRLETRLLDKLATLMQGGSIPAKQTSRPSIVPVAEKEGDRSEHDVTQSQTSSTTLESKKKPINATTQDEDKKTMDDVASTLPPASASSKEEQQSTPPANNNNNNNNNDRVVMDCGSINLELAAIKIRRWEKQAFATACPRSAFVIS